MFRFLRKINYLIYIISNLVISLLLSWKCDKGIGPKEEYSSNQSLPYGISGTVYFKNWPPESSLVDLRLVAFKNYPPGNILEEVMQRQAQYTETLEPFFVDSLNYTLVLTTLSPGTIEYIVVAQQYGPNIQTDWRMVGVYFANGDTTYPGIVMVPSDTIVAGININVDFLHPPVLP